MTWWCKDGHNYYGRRNTLAADLVQYGISVAELFVMDTITWNYLVGILWPRAQLAVDTFGPASGWPGLHCEDCLRAIDRLTHIGLLQMLTEEQVQEWVAIRSADAIPSCVDKDFRCGILDIDFTRSGYELYGRIQREVFGCVRLGVRQDPDELIVVILSEDEEALLKETDFQAQHIPFDSARSAPDRPVKARLRRIVGPTKVGPWRLSRFEVLPSGFMTVMEYE